MSTNNRTALTKRLTKARRQPPRFPQQLARNTLTTINDTCNEEGPCLQLVLAGTDLARVSNFSLLNATSLGSSKKKSNNPNRSFTISKFQPGDNTEVFQEVYASDVAKGSRAPVWKEAKISLDRLCNGDRDWPLQVSLWEKDAGTGRALPMGSCSTTVAELVKAHKKGAIKLHRGHRFMGSLRVAEINITTEPSKAVLAEEDTTPTTTGSATDWERDWGIIFDTTTTATSTNEAKGTGKGSAGDPDTAKAILDGSDQESSSSGMATGWGILQYLVGVSNEIRAGMDESDSDDDSVDESSSTSFFAAITKEAKTSSLPSLEEHSETTNNHYQEDRDAFREELPEKPEDKEGGIVLSEEKQPVAETANSGASTLRRIQRNKPKRAPNRAQLMSGWIMESGRAWEKDRASRPTKPTAKLHAGKQETRASKTWDNAFWDELGSNGIGPSQLQESLAEITNPHPDENRAGGQKASGLKRKARRNLMAAQKALAKSLKRFAPPSDPHE